MDYSIMKQWRTMNGEYHSASVDRHDFDSAIGEFHAMFRPMQNDTNVKSFVLTLMDENGNRLGKSEWFRKVDE